MFFSTSLMNENYHHPVMPEGVQEKILKGMYRVRQAKRPRKQAPRVQLLGSGAILCESLAAADLLEKDFGVLSDVWSVTSFNELARDGRDKARWNLLHPSDQPRISFVEECLQDEAGPVIATTDYVRNYAEQIREFVPGRYLVLGTDGFGRSGTRKQLRTFFEIDRHYIALTALKALAEEDSVPTTVISEAIERYQIDTEKRNPIGA